jgi:Tfp pilus assembly protein PilV
MKIMKIMKIMKNMENMYALTHLNNTNNSDENNSESGFTLMETIISMLLFSFIAVAILYLMSFTTKASLLDTSLSNRTTHAVIMQSLLSATLPNAGSVYANKDAANNVAEYLSAATISAPGTVTVSNSGETLVYEYAAAGSTPALCTESLKLYAESPRTLSILTQASPASAISDCVTGSAQNPLDYTVPVGTGWSFKLDSGSSTECASGSVIATESFVSVDTNNNQITNATPVDVSICV